MTKPHNPAEIPAEAGFTSVVAPLQESLDRFHKAAERLSATYTEMAAEQANFLQRTVFDSLLEMQTLSRVRSPAEFFELSTEFAWQQAERSLKALGEIGSEACSCWFDALKAAPKFGPRTAKSRSLH